MSKGKKEYAPTVKLYPGFKEGTFNANINERTLGILEELTKRVEQGGRVSIRPVSQSYKDKCDGDAPEFELTVYTAAEVAEFKAFGNSLKEESI